MGQALIDAPHHAGEATGPERVARSCFERIEGFIDASDARLRLRVAGTGPALVLLHGWALDLDMWTPQFAALSGAYRVVAFDRRGFGLSTGTPSLAKDVEDLALVLDRLCIECAAVLGMSQGARVALHFAQHLPRRTACLILDGAPSMLGVESSELPLESFRELVSRSGLDAFRQTWLRHPLTQLRSQNVEARALVARMVARYRGLDLEASAGAAAPAAAAPDLNCLQGPALIISGALDSDERLEAAGELALRLRGAESVRIAGAAHLPNLDQPHLYNEALQSFLQRCAQHQSSWSESCHPGTSE